MFGSRNLYTQRNYVTISGSIEYTLRCMSNEAVQCEAYVWEIRKPVPLDMVAIPGTASFPVITGNLLNLLGQSMAQDLQTDNANGDASNDSMSTFDVSLPMLPLFNEYVKTKKYVFRLHPGKFKHFRVSASRLILSTADLYENINADTPYTDSTKWASAFVPGARGMLFRIAGSIGKPSATATPNENSLSQFTLPEVNLLSKSTYYVYPGNKQFTNPIFKTDFGSQAPAGNTVIVNDQTNAIENFTTV